MAKTDDDIGELLSLQLVNAQAAQFHRDLGVLISAGLAGTDASD